MARHFDTSTWTSRTGKEHLPGEILAGCTIIRKCANGSNVTRFLCRMWCGHEQITDGTRLRAEEKAGRVLRCKECSKRLTAEQPSAKAVALALHAEALLFEAWAITAEHQECQCGLCVRAGALCKLLKSVGRDPNATGGAR